MSNPSSSTVTVMTPNQRVKDSSFRACRRLAGEVKRNRGQIWSVFRQNFRSSYHGTFMGVVWNFILPIVPITVYLFLTQIRAFPSFEGVSGASYLTFGVMIWYVFAGFVQLPIDTVQSRNSEAMKTSLPLSASIVTSFANLIFETLVRMVFVLTVMIWTKSFPTLGAPLLLVVFGFGFFLFFGAGLLLSIMNVIYKDISRVTFIILQYGIFVSGVIFPMGDSALAVWNSKINPFAVFVDASRDVVFQGAISDPLPLMIWSGIGIIVFLLGCRVFWSMEFRIRGLI